MQNGDCATVAKCQELLESANRRLLKVIGDLDAAIESGNAKQEVVEAYKTLRDLYKEALGIKDDMIADLKTDNDFLRKKAAGNKSRLRQVLEKVEKVLVFAAGIYIGKGL